MASVVLLCVVAAVLFLSLVPAARGFVPGRRRAVRGPSILRRLAVNLRSPVQLALYAQGFLLMGAFVAVYNYLGFHLSAAPFSLPPVVITLLFLAYLAGTFSSPQAGTMAVRYGRLPVLAIGIAVMAAGAALMLVPAVVAVLAGLIAFTAGFFAAHAVASGWTPVAAAPERERRRLRCTTSVITRARVCSGGRWASSSAPWGGGGFAAVLAMCAAALALALVVLRRGGRGGARA